MAIETINGMKVLDWDEIDAQLAQASQDYQESVGLLKDAIALRQCGERESTGETWAAWETRSDAFLRRVSDAGS